MKFFFDSGDPSEIRTCDEQGIVDPALVGAQLATVPFPLLGQIIEQRR